MSDMFDHAAMAWDEYEEEVLGVGRNEPGESDIHPAYNRLTPREIAVQNAARDRVLARGKKKSDEPEPQAIRMPTGYWIFMQRVPMANKGMKIAGKYLFFSPDRELLLEIAEAEMVENGFDNAKVSRTAAGEDHVLCLYWEDDSRKWELAEKYGHSDNVKYRFWKSDKDTLDGKYSEQHRRNMR